MHEKLYSEGTRAPAVFFPSLSLYERYSLCDDDNWPVLSGLTDGKGNTEAITASLSSLSVDAQKRAEKDSKKKEAKAAAAEAREAEAKKEAMVYIKRVERNKRKYVTAISGLEAHGMDLKKVAKEFGKKCE